MQNKLDMLLQPSWVIGRPNHTMMEYSLLSRCNHKQGLMVQRPTASPGIPGQIVEV